MIQLPEIKIGKKYLRKPRPIELTCLYCGENMGQGTIIEEAEVIVLAKTRDSGLKIWCRFCRRQLPYSDFEGMYQVRAIDTNEVGAVPYTQLQEIEGEDYEQQ
uniref:Uncharacterized protein n=1 Tax=viral metagenome TaxID=1070528 RepID=A0A6H2A0S9_9ZZZZ